MCFCVCLGVHIGDLDASKDWERVCVARMSVGSIATDAGWTRRSALRGKRECVQLLRRMCSL